MLLRRRVDVRDDEGAYAILFALLVFALVGVVAFALDLAMVRESRAANRSISDSAAVAAAGSLQDSSGRWTPNRACHAGWDYLAPKIPNSSSGPASCDSASPSLFTDPVTVCPTTPSTATWTNGDWRVVITWPVPRYLPGGAPNPLLDAPDTKPANPTQGFNSDQDGTDAGCDRISVQVFQDNHLGLSGIFGVSTVTTSATSVSRSVVTGQVGDVLAALNILEPTKCDALTTSGQAGITVGTTVTGSRAGVIAVESTATQPGNATGGCGNANQAAIKPSSNVNNFIRAIGPTGTTPAIFSWALNSAGGGNASRSYAMYPGTNPNITPTPTTLTSKVGSKPITDIFQCTGTCPSGRTDYIGTLNTSYGGSGAPTGFMTLPNAAFPTFVCNQNAASPTVVLPSGNYYIDCATFGISTTVIFQGGNVVTRGPVELGSNTACLAVNVPATTCPTINTAANPVTTAPAPNGDSVLYIRSGRLYKVSQAALFMPRTMTYLGNGFTELGGGSGSLLMTSPTGLGACAATDLECRYSHFYKLTLWSLSSSDHNIGGQSYLGLRGVLFTPNAKSIFTGQGGSAQTSAQFWTNTLEVKGQGELIMDVDPDAAVSRPSYGGTLIR